MPSSPSTDPSDALKAFSLTHILYDPSHHFSIPFALLSLSPIFLFVSYFTLVIFTRRLTILFLCAGQIGNEVLSLILKRSFLEHRPYRGVLREVGEGYGMPSSHSQAAGFLVAWGIGYALTSGKRRRLGERQKGMIGKDRELIKSLVKGIYIFGLVLWSIAVAYSRWYLRYHSPAQIIAGYTVGLVAGALYFVLTEYIPLYHPTNGLGQLRSKLERIWEGVGGVGGWSLGAADGGWGEGWVFVEEDGKKK